VGHRFLYQWSRSIDSRPASRGRLGDCGFVQKNINQKSCRSQSYSPGKRGRDVSLVNTHPFSRHFWGHTWSFAHNGELDNLSWLEPFRFRPIGTTNSELAFCWILDHLTHVFPDHPEDPKALGMALQELCDKLRGRGIFNRIMTDSRRFYTYCSTKMCRLTRRAPFGEAILNDGNMSVNFGEVTTDRDVVTVVATPPLTDNEEWTSMAEGELCIIEDGEVTSFAPVDSIARSA